MNLTRIVGIALLAALLCACGEIVEPDPVPAGWTIGRERNADDLLARKVERALGTEHGLLPYGVEVTAHRGRVVLWGTVASQADADRFETKAAGVVGVRLVVNQLRVDPGA